MMAVSFDMQRCMYSEDTQQQSLENVVCFKILTKKNPMDQIPNSKEEKRNPTIEIRRRKFQKRPTAYCLLPKALYS
jgi:hypothetical protein